MGRTRTAALVVAALLGTLLLGAGTAQAADTVVVDSVDVPQPSFEPANVTIKTGDTVRWEFDEATAFHTVTSTSENWSANYNAAPGADPFEHTFDAPGTYTFVCQAHPATMTGSITVEDPQDPPADPLEKVLVFSKTAGFRHGSIPDGIAMIEQLGAENDFAVDATEDSAQFTDANLSQYDAVVFLSTTGDVLNDTQQAAFERFIQAGNGYVGIHAAADTEYDWPWYGELLGGGWFDGHPAIQEATVDIEDGDEPSTQGLPAALTRTDEWYNYRANPRDAGVKVLATLDESTYSGGTMGGDHPITWCSDFDGGHVWYTGMGHTNESFTSDADFKQHVLGGLKTVTGAEASDCGEARTPPPSANDFEKVTIDDDTANPMELDVAQDGSVYYIERDGEVNVWHPDTQQTTVLGNIPVTMSQENGLLGIALAPDFETSHWLYLFYSQLPDASETQVISRFKVEDDVLDLTSEQRILTFQHQVAQCCHSSGALYFGPDGNLFASVGDNTNPFASDGFAPIDERPGRSAWDAQRTSANTNDLNGKILRIDPLDSIAPGAAPGVGSTYTIPAGNLFPEADDPDDKTRPEIYGMGFRNPFRFTVDSETGWVLMGDYGPDAGATNPNRGPQGSVEFNALEEAGNYGWPYCIRENVPYNDYDFATGTSGPKFDCDAPVNDSPNNTGRTNLPPAIPADAWLGYTETDSRFPQLGTGGAPTGGPRYHFDPDNPSETKFPAFYDDKWFIGEWNNGWIKTADLDDEGNITDVQPFALGTGYKRPHDIDFGPDGSLYVIEWGSGFGGNNGDSGIYRIDYVKGARRPIAHAMATPDSGPTPLEVQFSSDGSIDPESTALTYEWDFDSDGEVDSTEPNPTHTYTTNGTFNASLTVTDASGMTGVDNVQVIVGNTRPVVTIETPENGQFASFSDTIAYKVTVTDAEDGSTEDGSIDCADVRINVSLGHDEHAHTLSSEQGCEGAVQTGLTSGHGDSANTFTVIEAVYTDEGGPGGAGPIDARDIHALPPKHKQVEFFTETGRTDDSTGGGDPGVQTETTGDTAGGYQNIGFIEDGDWVSFTDWNFKDIDSLTFRVASNGAGGTIEVHVDAPDGPLVGESEFIPSNGDWQVYHDEIVPITDPGGTHDVYIVFRNTDTAASLMNINYVDAHGKGAAVSAPPDVSASAEPETGEAPLDVQFTGQATDPEAEALTYEWDFGVPGTDDDTSAELSPAYTYERAGTYTATFTATDPHGASSSATVRVRVTQPPSQCPTDGYLDEFDGSDLKAPWEVIRRDQNLVVADGTLQIPAQAGDLYGTGMNDAKNVVVQPAPAGAWTATAKIDFRGDVQYHQAGILVYGDDDNFTKFGRLTTNQSGSPMTEKFEFIYETGGVPRNETPDSTGNLPADFPDDYYLRITSDGSSITGAYSTDGESWTPVGRPAPLPANAKVGMFAFSNAATTAPVAGFDWFSLSGEGVGTTASDEFDGASLDTDRWNGIVRGNPDNYSVADGALNITTAPGDIYTGTNTDPLPENFILQTPANPDWTIETKVGGNLSGDFGQGGLIAYTGDDDYVKFDVISDGETATEINRIELRSEVGGTVQDPQPQVTPLPAGTSDVWLRLTKSGTTYTGEYSFDGTTWQPMDDAVANPMAAPKFGVYAFGVNGSGDTATFDYFRVDGGECQCTGTGDDFSGDSLDKQRWNSIRNEDTSKYVVEDGGLTVTTVGGDVRDSAPNLFLQSADHAGSDWTLETKLSGTIQGGFQQGGIIAFGDGANFVKLDAISDGTNTRIHRIELRSEVDDQFLPGGPNVSVPEGTTDIWLRLKKAGETYTGEYSYDGVDWTTIATTVTNPVVDPAFGIYTVGVDGSGDTVTFDYLKVDGQLGCDDGGGPANSAPSIESATAEPTAGFAPLDVDFTVDASDADGDELSYSWDFDGDGTEDSAERSPSHTYTEARTHDATVTVSDGEAEATETVPVQVLEADDDEARFRVLAFSKTAGFRHSSIDEGHAALETLGDENGFQVDHSEDASLFRPAVLDHYDTVVFLSTTGDVLGDAQQTAFEDYIRAGGGYAGIHAASDTEYGWKWYGNLVGAYFRNHPAQQDATLRVEDHAHPSTAGLPDSYGHFDEWYNYKAVDFEDAGDGDYSPRDQVHVLVNVDESTYDEDDGNATDDDHPVTWCHRYDGGRAWYTGLGHTEASFTEPEFLAQVLGGIETTAGAAASDDCGVSDGGGEPGDPTVEAFADPQSGSAPLRVRFSAAAIDPEGRRLAFHWEFGDGADSFARRPRHTYTEAGTFTAKVTVTDRDGNTASDEVEVIVNPQGSQPPAVTVTAEPESGVAPLKVRFQADGDDPDDRRRDLIYAWDFGDGNTAFGRRARHTYMETGDYTATVTVTDPHGNAGTDEVQITVTDPPGNLAPAVEAAGDPTTGVAPLSVRLTSRGTDPDGDRLTYAWDFGDGSEPGDRRNARHTYTEGGTYTATVTVTDASGATASADVEIEVTSAADANHAPTVRAAADPASGVAPLRVRFSAAGADADGDRLAYVWDFGDGTRAGGASAVHRYAQAGTYTATVTVTDRWGESGSATVPVAVAAPAAAPRALAAPPAAAVQGETAASPSVRVAKRRGIGRVMRRGLRYRVACEDACRVSAQLRISRKVAKRLGLADKRRIGHARRRHVAAGKSRTIVVRLGRKARRALRHADAKRVRATVVTRVRTEDGTRRLRSRILLKR